MPRNGSGVYSADWVNASPNTTIESAKQNAMVADLVADANAARPVTAGGTGETTARLKDGTWRFQNTADQTKLLAFDLSGLTTATTRTVTVPDKSGTLAMTSDVTTPTAAKTAAYTVLSADNGSTILADATSAAFTVTLLAAATAGNGFPVTVKKIDASTNDITVDADGSETIDGALTTLLTAQGQSVSLVCDGSNWHVTEKASPFPSIGTLVTTTGGTAIDFAIPAGVKCFSLMLSQLSTTGPDELLLRLGTSGGIKTTGYRASYGALSAGTTTAANSTVGFQLDSSHIDGFIFTGKVTFTLMDPATNRWNIEGRIGYYIGATGYWSTGDVTMTDELTTLRLTTVSPSTDTFDDVSANIMFHS